MIIQDLFTFLSKRLSKKYFFYNFASFNGKGAFIWIHRVRRGKEEEEFTIHRASPSELLRSLMDLHACLPSRKRERERDPFLRSKLDKRQGMYLFGPVRLFGSIE